MVRSRRGSVNSNGSIGDLTASFGSYAGVNEDTFISHDLENEELLDDVPLEQLPDNSMAVIFSVWSTMMGSTVLIMPKLFRNAGVWSAVAATIFIGALAAYTAVCVARLGKYYGPSTKHVLESLPKALRHATLAASVLILVGANMLFHMYITQSLVALANKQMNNNTWRVALACGTAGAVFLISMLKSLRPLFVASSYGILIIMYCLAFIIVQAALQFKSGNCEPKYVEAYNMGWAGIGPVASLMSALTVSFLSHNFVLQLLSQSTRPAKNTRNVAVAYAFTALSYTVPSGLAVIAFRSCSTFSDDFVEMFNGPYVDSVRVAIVVLVLIIYPIIIFISRTQFVEGVFGERGVSYPFTLFLNFIQIGICTIPSALNMQATVIGALIGVFGTYWILILPPAAIIRAKVADRTASPLFIAAHAAIIVLALALITVTILAQAGVIAAAPPPPALSGGNVTGNVSGVQAPTHDEG